MKAPSAFRNTTPADFPRILQLNAASEHFLSPLTPARLESLHQMAAYHRVLEQDGAIVAFLMAFREGTAYDSLNYRWFCKTFDRFLYIDRIVVADESQGQGIGPRFYANLFEFARRTDAGRVTCEFDIDPPNEASRRFHERQGFREVGTHAVAGGKKQVSLQAVSL